MKSLWTMFLPAACVVAACATNDMPGPSQGQLLFAQNCTSCHGADATGGVGPDLTRIAARNGGTFPRAAVLSQIDGYGRGSLSEDLMPEFGSLLEGDTVPVEVDGTLTPTPSPLAALLAYLESVQQP